MHVSQIRDSDQSLSVDGIIFGRKHRIIIDTGASRSFIKRKIAPLSKIKPTERMYTLVTATGEKTPIYGVNDVEFSLGTKTFAHSFLIADIVDDVILGLDFLQSRNGIVLDLDSRILRLGSEEIMMTTHNEKNITLHVAVTEDVTLAPQTETLVETSFKGDITGRFVGLVEPACSADLKGILPARTLLNVDSACKVIKVANLNNYACELKTGTVIGTFEPVRMIVNCTDEISVRKTDTGILVKPLHEVFDRSSKNLNEEERHRLKCLFVKYQDVFSLNDDDYGRTRVVQHCIDTESHSPIKQPPRRVPFAKQKDVDDMLLNMQEQGVIEPSTSPWTSPVVLVKKKDGTTRFCVDYRRLNDITKKDNYPLPRIDDTLDSLAGCKWFTTLDLKSGYWQVELNPADKEKTAFSTGKGLWQFTVMPFGLCNAPATFERLMENVLRGLHWKTCLVYLDDIIVYSNTFEEHIQNLEEVFQKLQMAKLKLNPKKCVFLQREVKYLGHVITGDGIKTDAEKTSTVRNWPVPRDKKELRSFLGLCTYYRRFVRHFADLAKPLHRLTEKDIPFVWTTDCETAFEKLKITLCSTPVLSYPQPGAKFILDTDASNTGIGAVLSQEIDGEEKVIAYFSKVLSKAERNYCVTRKELLAVVKAIEHFHKYLYGQPFVLQTDHASLKWLMQFKNPEGQIARWLQRLQEYQFQIQHRRGSKHNNADALSRRPCIEDCRHCQKVEGNESLFADCRLTKINSDDTWNSENLGKDQDSDEDIGPIKNLIENGLNRPSWNEISQKSETYKSYWAQWNSLIVEDGIMKRVWESNDGKEKRHQTVVPQRKIYEVLKEYHDGISGGHFGINKTLAKIRQRFYWLKCRDDVEDWCRKCKDCISSKGPKLRSRGHMKQYVVGAPFERVAVDVAGPFPATQSGNRYILVAIDYFTKWPEVYAIPNQEAKTIAEVLVSNMFCRFGIPRELHSDQGRNFESEIFQKVCEIMGIYKTRTTPLHPQSDGMAERFNKTIEDFLKIVVSDHQNDWDKYIPLFLLAYRSSVHETTGKTPSSVVFGRELRLPSDIMFGTPEDNHVQLEDYLHHLSDRLKEVHNFVRQKGQLASDRMKTRYDRRANEFGFKNGDKVWFYNPIRRKGRNPKLQKSWEGPYTIIKRINDVVYRIQKNPRTKMKVIHVDRIVPYIGDDRVDHS